MKNLLWENVHWKYELDTAAVTTTTMQYINVLKAKSPKDPFALYMTATKESFLTDNLKTESNIT